MTITVIRSGIHIFKEEAEAGNIAVRRASKVERARVNPK